MHEPLYDLYCQLLQGIGTFSVDEFDAITREEALVPRLNALDQACEARGITGLGAGDGDNVTPLARPPDAVMRALRADVKRREAESIRAKLGEAEKEAAEARRGLSEKSKQAREMAQGLRAGAADLQGGAQELHGMGSEGADVSGWRGSRPGCAANHRVKPLRRRIPL